MLWARLMTQLAFFSLGLWFLLGFPTLLVPVEFKVHDRCHSVPLMDVVGNSSADRLMLNVVDFSLSFLGMGFILKSGPQLLQEDINVPQLQGVFVIELVHPFSSFPLQAGSYHSHHSLVSDVIRAIVIDVNPHLVKEKGQLLGVPVESSSDLGQTGQASKLRGRHWS